LIVDDGRVDAALCQRQHGGHEVPSIADHPRRAHDVVAGHGGDHLIGGGLGLPVHAEGRDGVVLGVGARGGPVEDVIARDVDQRDAVLGGDARQSRGARDVDRPRRRTALRCLRRVDGGVGCGVDDRVVVAPAAGVGEGSGRQVDVGAFGELHV
jgi:hypothetical protein